MGDPRLRRRRHDGIIKPLGGEKCGKTPKRAGKVSATTIIVIARNKGEERGKQGARFDTAACPKSLRDLLAASCNRHRARPDSSSLAILLTSFSVRQVVEAPF